MPTGAKAGSTGSILICKEHACAALHPPPGGAVQPPIDAKPLIAAIAYGPDQNQPAQIRIINGVMADRAVASSHAQPAASHTISARFRPSPQA